TDRHHVLVPGLHAPARLDAHQPGLADRCATGLLQQPRTSLVIGHVAAAEHVAIADAMLHGNVPAPAGGMRVASRVGRRRFVDDGLERDRAVALQPVRVVFVARLDGALDEQRTEAGAVEEEISRDDAAVLELERLDVTVTFARAYLLDLAFRALDAARFGDAPHVARIQRGVEV